MIGKILAKLGFAAKSEAEADPFALRLDRIHRREMRLTVRQALFRAYGQHPEAAAL